MSLLRNCKETTALIVAKQDRALSTHERVALHLHLLMCRACSGFAAQMSILRRSAQAWRHYIDHGDDSR